MWCNIFSDGKRHCLPTYLRRDHTTWPERIMWVAPNHVCSSLFLFRTFLLSLTITIEHCTERCLHEAVGDESWKLTTGNLITRRYTEQPKWPLEEFAGRVSIFCARTSFCANLDAQCQHSASFQDTYILCRGSKKFSEENINYNKMLEVHNLIKICRII